MTDAEHAPSADGHIPHGDFRSYMTGFVLSVILTAIPFILVMSGGLESRALTAVIVLLFAVVQIVVHMIYFLHMDLQAEGGWNMTALVFTLIVLVICLAGTMWVMHHMDSNMMPDMMEVMDDGGMNGQGMSEPGLGESDVPGQDMSPNK
ncbi:cytochrome o ubiquinol oxidase subunit IV [Granulosicoccus antarcticus]|uniref:Cytochrome bo(3) ubiquinol oxidase subunit 4 n=1 Tax=Granulosicoccus antarcticus IMCC3135 TaxID=1192854 RepID=A0A2Z2P4T2_9GAMM|nr:cytochrome o ubiquinol oxidase subunit IV [Granulosicoccus antarcticus]ASJ75687.1 Cytochrome bo(3) ubiquinol oxidase subunit 4 [Granulosicoccus antarcticus IMCC3135]